MYIPDQTKHLPESERERFVAGISPISRWSSERGDLEALSLLPCKFKNTKIEGHSVSIQLYTYIYVSIGQNV